MMEPDPQGPCSAYSSHPLSPPIFRIWLLHSLGVPQIGPLQNCLKVGQLKVGLLLRHSLCEGRMLML